MTIKVIRRKRLGNNTEDITLLPPRRGQSEISIAIMDGYDVLDVPLSTRIPARQTKDEALGKPTAAGERDTPATGGQLEKSATKLFDVLGMGIQAGPRGIAYIESLDRFVIADLRQPTKLFLAGRAGRPLGTLDIGYLNGYVPTFIEGLDYIPSTSRNFPDHLVMIAFQGTQSRLEVIRPEDGQVAHEIIPADLNGKYLTGVCYWKPDQLLVSTSDDNQIMTVDFSGNVIAPGSFPTPLPLRSQGLEGLTRTPDNSLAVANYRAGIIALFREGASRPRSSHYPIGVGLSIPTGLTWDTTRNRHLVCSFARFNPVSERLISSVGPSLDAARQIVGTDITGRQLAYLTEEKLIALTQRSPTSNAILLFNERGQQVERIDIDPQAIGPVFALAYLPKVREFLISTIRLAKLLVLSRQGEFVREIDVASADINRISSIAFNPGHPRSPLLLTDRDSTRAVFVNLKGEAVDEFDVKRDLKLLRPSASSAITTGPDAGAFCIVDPDNSELVIFRAQPS